MRINTLKIFVIVVVLFALGVKVLPSSAAGTLAFHLPFNESADATTFADASGNDHQGTCSGDGCPTAGVSGMDGTALSFDGADDYVEVAYNAALNPESFTVMAWARVTSGAGQFRSLVTARGYETGYMIYASSLNTWQFLVGKSGGGWAGIDAAPVITDVWTHVAGVYDAGTESMYLYLNGNLAGTQTSVVLTRNTLYPLRVGAGRTEETGADYFFPGEIDDVRIYNGALSPAEIQAIVEGVVSCYVEASNDDVADYVSSDASAVQMAIDNAGPDDLLKVAGTCAGMQSHSGHTQSVYLGQSVTLQGGYTTTHWLATPDPATYATLDAQNGGRVLYVPAGTTATVDGLTLTRGYAVNGGGIYNAGTLTLTQSIVHDNEATTYGGGMYNDGTSPTLADVTFSNNSSSNYGGGMYNNGFGKESSPTLTGVTFNNNYASQRGGGIFNYGGGGVSAPALTNVIFHDNMAGRGGAIHFYGDNGDVSATITNGLFDSNGSSHISYDDGKADTQPHFINCTFHGATSEVVDIYGFDNDQTPIDFTNCIFWGNNGDLTNWDPADDPAGTSALNVQYSIVEESDFASGTGNLTADPQFVDAAGGNLRVHPDSPAVDAGDDSAVPPGVTTDLDGIPRIVGSVDMGAYETAACFVETSGDDVTDYASADAGAVQQAVDAASPGDLIRVAGTCAGVQTRDTYYDQTVYISQSLTLRGGYSPADWTLPPDPAVYTTTLDAQQAGRVVYISGTVTVTLDGLVVTRGFAEDDSGGGVRVDNGGTLTVTQSTFADNEAGNGGALYGGGATLFIAGSTFTANHAYDGGGIYVWGNALTISDTLFYTNTADYDGGAIYSENNALTLEDVTLRNNAGGENGGAISAVNSRDGTLFATRSTFQENRASEYGGAIYNSGVPMTMTHAFFYTNTTAYGGGGAIYVTSAPTVLDDLDFSGNTASVESYGGAVYTQWGSLVASNATFRRNNAEFDGGAIRASYTDVNVAHSTFQLNSAGRGGAIRAYYSPITVTHSAFYTNTATSGRGGGIDGLVSKMILEDVLIRGNRAAGSGGGVYLYEGDHFNATNSIFQQNSTSINGGGLYVRANATTVSATSFLTNTAGDEGGGMYNYQVRSTILNDLIFSGNSAFNGGGLVNATSTYNSVSPALDNVLFNENSAIARGGGVYNDGEYLSMASCTPTLTNVTFRDNAASFGGALYFHGYDGSVGGTVINGLFDSNGNDHIGYNDGDTAAQPHFINCTFTGALSRTVTIEYFDEGLNPISFTNSIFWDDGGDLTNNHAAVDVTHSIVEEAAHASGTGNAHADPLFVDAAGGDLRLRYGSPAIDGGNTAALPADVTTDLDDQARVSGTAVDMGAYEFQQDVLALAKSVTPTTIALHDTVTYTLVLHNMRADDETAVVLTDTLPAGVDFSGWISAPAGTLQAGNALTWTGALSSTAQLTFVFTATHTGDHGDTLTNTAHFSGSLQQGRAWATFTVFPNRPPVLAPIGEQSVAEGTTLTFTVSASDPDGTTPVLSADNLPADATFAPATGLFTWTPGFDAAGVYTPTFSASDGLLTDTETITITVTDTDTNRPPVADAGPDQEVAPHSTITLDGSSSYDPDGDTLTYLWTRAGDPTFTSPLSVTTFSLPAATSVFTFTLTVTDTAGLHDSDVLVVHVTDFYVYLPLVCHSQE